MWIICNCFRKCTLIGCWLAPHLLGVTQTGSTPFLRCCSKYLNIAVTCKQKEYFTNHNIDYNQACEELGCRIDYLATHDYEGNANHVMNRLEMLYNRWADWWFTRFHKKRFWWRSYNRYGKKIWLTEFAKCCTRFSILSTFTHFVFFCPLLPISSLLVWTFVWFELFSGIIFLIQIFSSLNFLLILDKSWEIVKNLFKI